ncbi:MAG: aquaporin [Armatimonadetes bacterium]|nr:aquaporin [Armatimonadota bacterium]
MVTEFVGTFFLVLVVCLAGGQPMGWLAIGVVLMVMVYMGGPISGGHYNPAVSTAALLAKKMPSKDYGPYVLSQIVGGIAAAFVAYLVSGHGSGIKPSVGALPAFLVEVVFTFALCLVVLNVACSKRSGGNSYFGLAIGGTVLAAAAAGGGLSGGAFNPAVGIALTLGGAFFGQGGQMYLAPGANGGGAGDFAHVWLYILGPLLGAVLAAPLFRLQEEDGSGTEAA